MPPTFIPIAFFVLCSFLSPFLATVLAVLALRRSTRALARHALLAGAAGIVLCIGACTAIRMTGPDQSGIPSWITWATAAGGGFSIFALGELALEAFMRLRKLKA
jgi:NO-binding membrane sensor protein with MHYT domain